MGTTRLSKIFTAFFIFSSSLAIAQSNYGKYDGDALSTYLGKEAENQELKNLETNYNCEMANESHYLSKSGIELIMKEGHLGEIHLYNNSNVYGDFKGSLPKGLKFGVSSADVKKILGKPSVDYSSGYSEYELTNYTISCWFEGGKLTQLGIIEKSAQ